MLSSFRQSYTNNKCFVFINNTTKLIELKKKNKRTINYFLFLKNMQKYTLEQNT